ncbi:MAG: hypothetical protein AAGA81_09425 [Acidobacteriota bacterium]
MLRFTLALTLMTGLYLLGTQPVLADDLHHHSAYSQDPEPEPCVTSETSLCLGKGRFQVDVAWQNAQGQSGFASHVELSDGAAYFWFFDRENPEVFVKIIDACAAPFDRYWVFLAGLTDVGVVLTVTDTATGESKSYINPQGNRFEAVQDTDAFAGCSVD